MPICPTCGSLLVCPHCHPEANITAWLVGPSAPGDAVQAGCPVCGYAGDMTADGRGMRCPACGIVYAHRANMASRIAGTIQCSGCGRKIAIAIQDVGKTVICPGCARFLGAALQSS